MKRLHLKPSTSSDSASLWAYLVVLFRIWKALVSGGFGILFTVYGLTWKDSPQAPIAIILGCVAFLYASYLAWKGERSKLIELGLPQQSKLRIGLGSGIVGCDVSTDMVVNNNGNSGLMRARHLRIRISAEGGSIARQCAANIISIITPENRVLQHEYMTLRCSGDDEVSTEIDIRPGVDRYFDFLTLFVNNRTIILGTPGGKSPASYGMIFKDPGTYFIILRFTAENASSEDVRVKFVWPGEALQANLEQQPMEQTTA